MYCSPFDKNLDILGILVIWRSVPVTELSFQSVRLTDPLCQVCEIVSVSSSLSIKDTHCMEGIMAYSDSGLPGILFSLLDQEEDSQVWSLPERIEFHARPPLPPHFRQQNCLSFSVFLCVSSGPSYWRGGGGYGGGLV